MNNKDLASVIEIHKNDFNVIRITKQTYKNSPFISIRQWFKDLDGDYKPTKKGITCPPNKLSDFIKALQKFVEHKED